MIALLGLLSLVGVVVSIIFLIVAAIRKKPLKTQLIRLAACFCVFLFCVSQPSDGENADNEVQQKTDSPQSAIAPTQDELSEDLKESAIKAFSDGNYQKGLETCEQITTDYPNSQISASINDFISGQLDQYLHISAKDLMLCLERLVVLERRTETETLSSFWTAEHTSRASSLTLTPNTKMPLPNCEKATVFRLSENAPD